MGLNVVRGQECDAERLMGKRYRRGGAFTDGI